MPFRSARTAKRGHAAETFLRSACLLGPKEGIPFQYPPAQPMYPYNPQYPIARKDKTAAGLFAFFLGGWGVHGFYLGNTAMGATLLALWIVGLMTMWIIIGFLPLSAVRFHGPASGGNCRSAKLLQMDV